MRAPPQTAPIEQEFAHWRWSPKLPDWFNCRILMQPSLATSGRPSSGRLLEFLCLLWLAGVAMRITILAVPPVIPLIRDDLHMTETQVGLLIALPLVTWAFAAVPGSLLIARSVRLLR